MKQRILLFLVIFIIFLIVSGFLFAYLRPRKKTSSVTTTTKPPVTTTTKPPVTTTTKPPVTPDTTFTPDNNCAIPSLRPPIIHYGPNPSLPTPPREVHDYFAPLRESQFQLRKSEGTYSAFWYGNNTNTNTINTINTLVHKIDEWYLIIQNRLKYSVVRTLAEQHTEKYKMNIYLHSSGLGPPCPNPCNNNPHENCARYPMDHCMNPHLGTFRQSPHYILVNLTESTILHELGHLVQIRSGGGRNGPSGWAWESNAEYIVYKVAKIQNMNATIDLYIDRAAHFLRDYHWKRMDTFEDLIQYRSWIFWQCLEVIYGEGFVGQMWSNVDPKTPVFQEIARVRTGGDIATMFAQYVRCAMQLDFGDAKPHIEKTKRGLGWSHNPFPMMFEETILRSARNELEIKNHRLQPFGFVVVDIGSPLPGPVQQYRAKIVPLEECQEWRGVYESAIIGAHEWTRPFNGQVRFALGVTYAGQRDLAKFKIAFEEYNPREI
jgi:hypothetical protein